MDFKIVCALLLCVVTYNNAFCLDSYVPYPVPFELGCVEYPPSGCATNACGSTSSCTPSACGCASSCTPSACGCASSCTPSACGSTSSCSPSACSCTSPCTSWYRDAHNPCNTVDVVYFPEVQYPCGLECWDKPYYYGTYWCT